MTSVIVAIITGGLSLLGVILSNRQTEAKIHNEIITNQAVTEAKIEELTREVREHNGFARRMPVVENEILHIKADLKRLHGDEH